jgi:hypothetical protein
LHLLIKNKIASDLFGIRAMNVALRLFSNLLLAGKSWNIPIMSALSTSQQAQKKAIEKP